MPENYPKECRLISKSDFKNIFINSKRIRRNDVSVFFKCNGMNRGRLGISISRKVCKSHLRNRFKRRIREHFRLSDLRSRGIDILVIVKKRSLSVTELFTDLVNE